MFYLTMHSTHFIYSYMASDIWLRTILKVRKETCCHHIGYSYRLTARVLLYAPSHRQDNTYHSLCYTSRGALAGTRNSSMGPPHEGSIRRPTAPWANALPLSYFPLLVLWNNGGVSWVHICNLLYMGDVTCVLKTVSNKRWLLLWQMHTFLHFDYLNHFLKAVVLQCKFYHCPCTPSITSLQSIYIQHWYLTKSMIKMAKCVPEIRIERGLGN